MLQHYRSVEQAVCEVTGKSGYAGKYGYQALSQ